MYPSVTGAALSNYTLTTVAGVLTIVAKTVTGINDAVAANEPEKIAVYPNPSNGTFSIENFTGNVMMYQLSHTNGYIVREGRLATGKNFISLQAPVGIYFLKMDGRPVKKIVIE